MVDSSVVCPKCGVTRDFVPRVGTNKRIMDSRIRCRKGDGGCGKPFHTSKNMVTVVPQEGIKIKTDKVSDKNTLIIKIKDTLDKYKDFLPLDILRSKLLELESIGEMRKK